MMIKYRPLTNDELVELEKEFVNFLVFQTITADKWETLKATDKERVGELIDIFSDMVFEKIMLGVKFLEFRSAKEWKTFQCLEDRFVEIGIKLDAEDNRNVEDWSNNILNKNNTEGKLYLSQRKYVLSREKEIFDMTERGYIISDGKLFKNLCLFLPVE